MGIVAKRPVSNGCTSFGLNAVKRAAHTDYQTEAGKREKNNDTKTKMNRFQKSHFKGWYAAW